MAGKKISVEFDAHEDMVKMLERATGKYNLEDKSKALRCLLDFAATDGDWDIFFKQIRLFVVGLTEVGSRKNKKPKKASELIYSIQREFITSVAPGYSN